MTECSSGRGKKSAGAGQKAPDGLDVALAERLGCIRNTVLVLSGKGGVGKSTLAVNLARLLADGGVKTGLLDVDFHGPSVPVLLGLQGQRAASTADGLLPVEVDGLKVMSISFLLEDRDAAVIWRGPMKMGVIKQLLGQVEWGDLDALVIDVPPGTGDAPLSVCQLVGAATGALVVTTPQEVAVADVRRSISFCRQLGLPILGVVENMSGYTCPACGETTEVFRAGGGESMATEQGEPFLGRIPLDPTIVAGGDAGEAYVRTHPDSVMARVLTRVRERLAAPDPGS